MTTVKLPMLNGRHTLVDADIAERLGDRSIFALGGKHGTYAGVYDAGRRVLLHRLVVDAPPGSDVDHINRAPLDNRRANLRLASRSLNAHNTDRSWGGCPYRGVSWRRLRARFRVCLQVREHRSFLGHYQSQTVAALFYDVAKRTLLGDGVATNFPRAVPRSMVCRFIAETKGRIFTVVFSRRSDGAERVMTCRTGVHSKSKGGTAAFSHCLKGLALVWDIAKQSYRTIPVDRVIAIKHANVQYRIEGNHESKNVKSRRAA